MIMCGIKSAGVPTHGTVELLDIGTFQSQHTAGVTQKV